MPKELTAYECEKCGELIDKERGSYLIIKELFISHYNKGITSVMVNEAGLIFCGPSCFHTYLTDNKNL
jgi:hypothetical protein